MNKQQIFIAFFSSNCSTICNLKMANQRTLRIASVRMHTRTENKCKHLDRFINLKKNNIWEEFCVEEWASYVSRRQKSTKSIFAGREMRVVMKKQDKILYHSYRGFGQAGHSNVAARKMQSLVVQEMWPVTITPTAYRRGMSPNNGQRQIVEKSHRKTVVFMVLL